MRGQRNVHIFVHADIVMTSSVIMSCDSVVNVDVIEDVITMECGRGVACYAAEPAF